MKFPLGRRTAVIAFVGLLTLGLVAGSAALHNRNSVPRYAATPEGENGEAEGLSRLEAYWNDRLTYPTGNYNPAWLQHAEAQAERIPSRVPKGIYPSSPRGVFAAASASRSAALASFDTKAAISLGPKPERMTGCGNCFDYTTTSGRINSIVIDPTTTTPGSITAYSAAVGGGVWKTTNCCSASTSWTVTTDDPFVDTSAIDTLALDPNDHNTIYAGTGDLNYGSFSMGSKGILKSTDGGGHWTVLGADLFGPAYSEPAGQFPQYDAVGKVRVDPNDSDNVVAGTKKGLFFSYDGGQNWTGPCTTNGFTTMRQDITGLELSNMGGGVTRIVAAVGVRGFATTVQYDLGQNGANGIYSATMAASGCPSFTSIARNDNGFVFGTGVTGSAYPTGAPMNAGSGTAFVNSTTGDQAGRIDIGVAPSNPNVIYAQVQSIVPNNNSGGSAGCGNANGCQIGAWATTDGGTTWSFMAGSQGGLLKACANTGPGSSTTAAGDYPQNWYDQGVAVDPNNPDRVFFDTFEVWLATRTGTTWYDTTCGYSGVTPKPVHVDQHALAFVPGSSSVLLAGNDGGVHGTANADAAALNTLRPTWFNMDTGFNTIEYYSGDISGNFATAASPSAAGGAQDNAPSVASFPGGATGPVQWQLVTGGDGFYARIDPVGSVAPAGTQPRYFVGNNSGGMSRCVSATCTSTGIGNYSSVRGSWTGDTQSFIFPFDLFHGGIPGGDDCAPAGVPGGCGHLIGGTTRVWETVAGGNATMPGAASWYVTNNPSNQNMTKQSLGNRSFINQVKYSPKYSSVAIVGTNDANVWIGFNLGTGVAGQANWVNVTGANAVLPNRPVLGIALDPSAPTASTPTGYAALGGFNGNTPASPGHVYQVVCDNLCANPVWTDRSGNLPDIPVDSIIVNPNFPQQVFAGTDFGLYFTNDINAVSPTWFRFDKGLPHTMIWDLQIDRGATTLSVWTRGRGAYVWQLPNAPVELSGIVGLDSVLFGNRDALIDSYDSSVGPYGGANAGDSVTLLSNGVMSLAGAVHGDVRSTQSSVKLKKSSLVTGDVWAGTTIDNAGTVNGSVNPNSPVAPLVPDAVPDCSPYSDGTGLAGGLVYDAASGDLTVQGGKTATIAAGTYCFHKVTLGGGATLTATGPVVLRLTDKLEAGGGSRLLTSSSAPADLKIRSSFTGDGGVSFGGGGQAYVTVYAPQTGILLGGGSVVYGSLVGQTLDISGDSAVHYDVH